MLGPADATELHRVGFEGFIVIAREMVKFRQLTFQGNLAEQLDHGLSSSGAHLRLEVGIGAAGPIGLGLYAVRADGQAAEIVYFEAPAWEEAVKFVR